MVISVERSFSPTSNTYCISFLPEKVIVYVVNETLHGSVIIIHHQITQSSGMELPTNLPVKYTNMLFSSESIRIGCLEGISHHEVQGTKTQAFVKQVGIPLLIIFGSQKNA